MAELELELELLTKEAAKDLAKFAKSFEKFASAIEKTDLKPNTKGLKKAEKEIIDFGKDVPRIFSRIELAAKESFRDAGRAARRFVSNAENSFERLKGSVFSVQTALFALGGAFVARELVQGIRAVTDAASIQENAVNALNSALRQSGDFSEDASRDLQDFASRLQDVTIVGDETTLQLLALAKSFDVSNERAKDLVEAAVNLSAARDIPLESAVNQLGKSLSGLAGELGESVAGIRNLTQEQLKAGAAIDLVGKRFGTAGKDQIATFSGAVDQLSNSFGDLLEEIGQTVTESPVVLKAIQSLGSVFKDIGKNIDDNSDSIGKFVDAAVKNIVAIAPPVVDTIGSIGLALFDAARVVNQVSGTFAGFFAAILDAAGQTASAFKLLLSPIKATQLVLNEFEKAKINLDVKEAQDNVRSLRRRLKALGDAENAREQKVRDRFKAEIERERARIRNLNRQIKGIDELDMKLAEAIDKSGETIKLDLEAFLKTTINLDDASEEFRQKFEELLNKLGQKTREARDNITETASDSGKTKKNLEDGGKDLADNVEKAAASSASFGDLDIVQGFIDGFTERIIQAAVNFANAFLAVANQGIAQSAGTLDQLAKLEQDRAEFAKNGIKEFNAEIAEGSKRAAEIRSELENAAPGGISPEEQVSLREELIQIEKDQAAIRKKSAEEQAKFDKQETEIRRQAAQQSREQAGQLVAVFSQELIGIFSGPLGEALGPLFGTLAVAGPEAAQAFIDGLVEQLPTIIENLAEAAPVIAVAIAENADVIVIALASGVAQAFVGIISNLDVILAELVKSIANVVVATFAGVGVGLVELFDEFKQLDLGVSIREAGDFIKEKFDEIVQDFKDALSNPLGDRAVDVTKEGLIPDNVPILGGLASGGLVGGAGNKDSEAFRLKPGELVVPDNTTAQLQNFLDGQEGRQQAGGQMSVLVQILDALKQPMNVRTTAEVNGQTLADIILSLNRANARLGA